VPRGRRYCRSSATVCRCPDPDSAPSGSSGVIQLGIDAFTVFGHVGFAVHVHAFQHGHLFTFNRNGELFETDFLIADTLVKAGHAAVAVGFQVVEGELNLLVVFVNGIDQATLRFTRQGEDVAVAVGVKLEMTAAEGDFLVPFRSSALSAQYRNWCHRHS
jgi:hypothetical protein